MVLEHYEVYEACFYVAFALGQVIEVYYVNCESSILLREVSVIRTILLNPKLNMLIGAKYDGPYKQTCINQ